MFPPVWTPSDFTNAHLTLSQFVPYVDRNARARNRETNLQQEICYGQLTHVFLIRILRTPDLAINSATEVAFAIIEECYKPVRHAASGFNIFTYTKRKAAQAVDIITVQGLVGRVYHDKKWAILDRNGALACEMFADLDEDTALSDADE